MSAKKVKVQTKQLVLKDNGTVGETSVQKDKPKKRNTIPQGSEERERAAKIELSNALLRIKKKYRVAIDHQFTISKGGFESYYVVRALEY